MLIKLIPDLMLYIVGLGLGSPKDITLRGIETIQRCEFVYLEAYTSLFVDYAADDGSNGRLELEKALGLSNNAIKTADRSLVEQKCEDEILTKAKTSNVAFLVVGDPFAATTHSDFLLRAKQMNIEVKAIHNASILTAIGVTGLQLYRFGETVSLCFWSDSWKPTSAFEKIIKNLKLGLHTLCLLDIKVKEQSVENMMRGREVYEPPRFMRVSEAAQQLTECFQLCADVENLSDFLTEESLCIGVARLGSDSQAIKSCSLKEMCNVDLGAPLHSLVIPASLHEVEKEMVNLYS